MAIRTIVVDGSAAVSAALVENAVATLRDATLIAPSLLPSEVASALSQLRWRSEITTPELRAALGRFLAMKIKLVPSSELIEDAIDFAQEVGWAKTYDAEYVVLAKRTGAALLTLDQRLRTTVGSRVDVISPLDL